MVRTPVRFRSAVVRFLAFVLDRSGPLAGPIPVRSPVRYLVEPGGVRAAGLADPGVCFRHHRERPALAPLRLSGELAGGHVLSNVPPADEVKPDLALRGHVVAVQAVTEPDRYARPTTHAAPPNSPG